MCKISSIVILYNSKLANSETLKSILTVELNSDITLKVNIWNNGPYKLEENDIEVFLGKAKEKNITVNIYEDYRNIALSKIYNFFIAKNDYDFISILDQDSQLESNFFNNISFYKNYDIVCPAVFIKNNSMKQDCPVHSKKYDLKIESLSPFIVSEVVTISSGLTLSRIFVKNVQEKFETVFNENFAFYQIDIELFLGRLKLCKKMEGICVGKMLHEITGKVAVKDMSKRVKLEYGYGKILSRYYIYRDRKQSLISRIAYTLKQIQKYRYDFKESLSLLKCAITKKHPRCKYNIELNKSPTYRSI